MTMMKMVKMKIKNTEDDKNEDVEIKVKMSMMIMKKFSHYDGYFVMKVILWWNFSRNEINPMMKVMIVNELMTGDISPVAMFVHVGVKSLWKHGSIFGKIYETYARFPCKN